MGAPNTCLVFVDGLTTITVAAPGAALSATTLPVAALTTRIYSGWTLTFASGHTAAVTADAAVGATSLTVSALAAAISTGDTASAPLYLWNGKPTPGDRLANWTPLTTPIGDTATRMSDGALSMFAYRTDYGASFELPQIPVAKIGGERLADYADRLVMWLKQGGTCILLTGDVEQNGYSPVGLMPGAAPSLALTDKVNLEYTLRVALVNLAASPVRMVCHYLT